MVKHFCVVAFSCQRPLLKTKPPLLSKRGSEDRIRTAYGRLYRFESLRLVNIFRIHPFYRKPLRVSNRENMYEISLFIQVSLGSIGMAGSATIAWLSIAEAMVVVAAATVTD